MEEKENELEIAIFQQRLSERKKEFDTKKEKNVAITSQLLEEVARFEPEVEQNKEKKHDIENQIKEL